MFFQSNAYLFLDENGGILVRKKKNTFVQEFVLPQKKEEIAEAIISLGVSSLGIFFTGIQSSGICDSEEIFSSDPANQFCRCTFFGSKKLQTVSLQKDLNDVLIQDLESQGVRILFIDFLDQILGKILLKNLPSGGSFLYVYQSKNHLMTLVPEKFFCRTSALISEVQPLVLGHREVEKKGYPLIAFCDFEFLPEIQKIFCTGRISFLARKQQTNFLIFVCEQASEFYEYEIQYRFSTAFFLKLSVAVVFLFMCLNFSVPPMVSRTYALAKNQKPEEGKTSTLSDLENLGHRNRKPLVDFQELNLEILQLKSIVSEKEKAMFSTDLARKFEFRRVTDQCLILGFRVGNLNQDVEFCTPKNQKNLRIEMDEKKACLFSSEESGCWQIAKAM